MQVIRMYSRGNINLVPRGFSVFKIPIWVGDCVTTLIFVCIIFDSDADVPANRVE